ncbi:MAG: hypothetical protein A3C85_02850 [Candidatus Doudnabacteria bacterium RIFCSPHIGHO2_02_FULL_48_21]|uniref:Radical SAM core domain-containing protein n=1 Tax=Candidatus Doudnabacteria bacterium RIFCSPLOWO2_02_FULL_48_13 TaxID=1817845 RepID=A0A1F5Q9L5_9BACT|nr:MAG: hypothetical protein A3K05_03395 [Candidatus Doudnabacteria bacterium RIFCSPHIGHO2_01_48_18]OGE79362.1 MAG: hypothetical protein A2668_02515 [Candidatus Doudnabacteria bacterium RIFCSPHIGHO2_01_FULL_48_180]OGE91346.1 MAG: hypothetical protein A3F44_03510 [Candidatus Doudnabacteria bacterium RIFCSPHIGHO2_12_FULL_47_25]OGE92891.1 MAG: hypothetical protein A3C85_02850 [Candidatus Doudnabacteria bacterium RIFCSPHIGHO2_02_FULL_48_21]OGE96680.1 MAG: hypothetical protein A3A83_01800 [Candidatu
MKKLRVVILKPSKYGTDGSVQRFRRGFMPNTTVPYIRSMTPQMIDDVVVETQTIDEYVQTDLRYLDLLRSDEPTLLALVGVQSHQFHRALDLGAYALKHKVRHVVIGGPHPMTCDTSMLHNRGVSFALAEAEMIWPAILRDAIRGQLQPVYGKGQRWQKELSPLIMQPPSSQDMKRYVVPLLGIYPARGCPYTCNFCSVIKIAGRQVRSVDVDTIMATLWAAKKAGIQFVLFTSDNFNKYADAPALLNQMIREKIDLPFMCQCDTQVSKQEDFIELLGRAGCFQMFVGVESLNRQTLLKAHKTQNHPQRYADIVRLVHKYGFNGHFSNIIGFPDDTEQSCHEHMAIIKELSPGAVSCYILCPLPGTEQYDDFRAEDLVYEKNLDRFDATCPTWSHPNLSPEQLTNLMFEFYRTFYSDERLIRSFTTRNRRMSWQSDLIARIFPVFNRYSVWRGLHPMAGGFWDIKRDHVSEYLDVRRQYYGYEHVPLPASLRLSEIDEKMNGNVKLVLA